MIVASDGRGTAYGRDASRAGPYNLLRVSSGLDPAGGVLTCDPTQLRRSRRAPEALVLSAVAAALGLLAARLALRQVDAFIARVGGERVPFWWDISLSPAAVGYAASRGSSPPPPPPPARCC